MGIAAKAKRYWAHVQEGTPGRRFRDQYERHAHKRAKAAMVGRVLKIAGAIVCILIGLVEIVFPGPAFVFLIVGGALLATESLLVARFMDWLELKLRSLWARLRGAKRPR